MNPSDGTLYIHPHDAAEFETICRRHDPQLLDQATRMPDTNQGRQYHLNPHLVARFNEANNKEGAIRAGAAPAAAPQPAATGPRPAAAAPAKPRSSTSPPGSYSIDFTMPATALSARPLVQKDSHK